MLFLLIFTSVVLGLFLAYTLWTRNFDYWEKKGVPSEKPSFPFGNIKPIFEAKTLTSDFFLSFKKKWPNAPLIGFYSFFKPMLVINDPQLVKTVLVTDFHKFTDTNFTLNKNDKILRRTSFWVKGHKAWKETRTRFTSCFTPARIKGMVNIMSDCLNRHIEEYYKKSIKEDEITSLMLLDSILRIALSIEVDLLKEKQNSKSELIVLLDETIASPNIKMTHGVPLFAPWLHNFLNSEIMPKEIQAFFVKLVMSCVQEREKSKTDRTDILQTLINVEKKALSEGKKGFDDIDWAANLMTFFLDATETTGLVFSFVLYRLAAHIEEQEKLRSEILEAGSSLEDFDFDKLYSIKRLEMFLNETLRLHTPLFVLTKTCVETTKLGDVVVEKGTPVFIPVAYFHCDPKYHPDPMTFDPERFSDVRSVPTYAFFPFGEGPRACLGKRYALTVMRVLLVGYLLNFRISLENDFELKYNKQSPFFMLFDTPPKFKFERLNDSKTA